MITTEQEYRMGLMRRILRRRRHSVDTRLGITGEDPMAKDVGANINGSFQLLGMV